MILVGRNYVGEIKGYMGFYELFDKIVKTSLVEIKLFFMMVFMRFYEESLCDTF